MTSRRSVLRWFSLTPLALLFSQTGCRGKNEEKAKPEAAKPVSLRSKLVHLVLVLGPWEEEARGKATSYAAQTLSQEVVQGYEEDAAAVDKLWQHFKDSPMALDEVDLASLSGKEQEILNQIIDGIYSPSHALIEPRYVAAKRVPIGQCLGARKGKG
jgi:hypothetical protein